MAKSTFNYVIYIRTTPEKLWKALTEPKTTKQFWCGVGVECDWKKGSSWRMMIPDGRVADSGTVIEVIPRKKYVLRWRNEFQPQFRKEGYSRMTCELEKHGDMVKLTITHEMSKPKSKFIEAVSNGWPILLSSLKSLLETGKPLKATAHWPKGK